jgi:hypothetical protein
MSEAEFMQMLCRHDWNYHYSDDPDVYRTGQYMERRITDAMTQNPELKTLYNLHRGVKG